MTLQSKVRVAPARAHVLACMLCQWYSVLTPVVNSILREATYTHMMVTRSIGSLVPLA